MYSNTCYICIRVHYKKNHRQLVSEAQQKTLSRAPRVSSGLSVFCRARSGRACCERQVDPFEILGPCLRMHVALCRRDARVSEELLNEARVSVPGDKTTGSVAQGVEAQRP